MKTKYKKILKIITENPEISFTELARKSGKTRQGIYYILDVLTREGIVEFRKANFKVIKDLTSVK